jgi:NitT/TauT family transport system substrate-binding protein
MLKWKSMTTILGAGALVLSSLGTASAADEMTLTLNWLAQPFQTGFFLAKEKGFYDDVDIDLTIIEGKGSSSTAQITAAGKTDVGFVSGPAAITLINKGAPLTIISEVTQGNFQALASLESSNINTPQDLIGKSVAVCPGCAQLPMLKGMLAKAGIDESEVDIQNVDQSAHISMLEEGKIDAVAGDPNTISIEMEARGNKVHNMFFKDWGIGLINYVLIVRKDKLEANPDLYKRFVDASLKGWRAVIDDPEAAITALQNQYPEIDLERETLLRQLTQGIIPFICVKDSPGIGKASEDLWNTTYDIMTNYMGLEATVDVADTHTDDYLPDELPACPSS